MVLFVEPRRLEINQRNTHVDALSKIPQDGGSIPPASIPLFGTDSQGPVKQGFSLAPKFGLPISQSSLKISPCASEE